MNAQELQKLKDALEIGRDAAHEVAQRFHEEMKGYREAEHKQVDKDVADINEAIAMIERTSSAGSAAQDSVEASWNIYDPSGRVNDLRKASSWLLDVASSEVSVGDESELAKATAAVDDALAACIGNIAAGSAVVMNEDQERPAFEAWARIACNMPSYASVNWEALWTKQAWEGWQARAVLSAAAAQTAAVQAENQASQDVLAERKRQMEAEGWTPAHDDQYQNDELSLAAACYTIASDTAPQASIPQMWPWPDYWWKPTTERRNLVKAGALILAEIERLDRAAMSSEGGANG